MYRRYAATAIVFLFFIAGIFGQDFSRPTKIFVDTVVSGDEPESAAVGIIAGAASLELSLGGYLPVQSVDQADFIITTTISEDDTDVQVEFETHNANRRNSAALAIASWSGQISLNLDKEIQSVVRREILPVLPPTVEVREKEVVAAAEDGEEWALLLVEEQAETGKDEISVPDGKSGYWSLDIGGVVLLPLSETALYARTGYGGKISFGYSFALGSMSLSTRLVSGGIWLPTDAPIPTEILAIPFGLDLKFASAGSSSIAPFVRIGGGATWLMVFPEGAPSQGKIVPYADIGIGTDIFFGAVFGIYIDVAFEILFEGSTTVMGVVPGLGMAFRF